MTAWPDSTAPVSRLWTRATTALALLMLLLAVALTWIGGSWQTFLIAGLPAWSGGVLLRLALNYRAMRHG